MGASKPIRFVLLPILVLGALAGCVDEKIVQGPIYDDPLDEARNFLGFTDHSTKLTTCGNCHVEKQGQWEETAHAGAWATLQANPGAQEFCEGCHTVGKLGNLIEEVAGYEATGEARYEDVQCESCHGPGLEHVQNPKDETVPLAPLQVVLGDDETDADSNYGCAECHNGDHHPFIKEWNESRHGEAANAPRYRTVEGCSECHGAEGVLAAWNVNTDYVEKGAGESIGITCAVCHDPHAHNNDAQLRFPVDTASVELNLCMRCHHKRAVPDLGEGGTSTRGPHSPQGPLLLGEVGEVGWTPPGFAYDVDRIRGTHGTRANERLCAGCHVNSYTETDPDGGFVFAATGHLFKAIPCLDDEGKPTADDSCALNTTERTFASCSVGGCHGDEDAALSALLLAQGRINPLVTDLENLLDLVPDGEESAEDTIFTVAEGARFNAELGAIPSSAVHNPFMTEALLRASITAVEDEYGVSVPLTSEPSAVHGAPGPGN